MGHLYTICLHRAEKKITPWSVQTGDGIVSPMTQGKEEGKPDVGLILSSKGSWGGLALL